MLGPEDFQTATRSAFWRGFMRGMAKGLIFCALVGLLAWPLLAKVAA